VNTQDRTQLVVGQNVRLKSFSGTEIAPGNCASAENYWLLIGHAAEVVAPKNEKQRLLVKFGVSVRSLGLHCHNEVENSLWVLESDLALAEAPPSSNTTPSASI
jgi:hypothetical protein